MPQQYHSKNQLIIGETAVHLAINNADITVNSLIRELTDMVAAEDAPARYVQIRGAKCWLRSFAALHHYPATALS